MKFGLCLLCADPPELFLREVRRVEEVGFEYLWLADMGLLDHDVFPYLALAATHTERVRLGACVHHPYVRHPAVTLNAMVTVDRISGGRGLYGVGTGGGEATTPMGFKAAKLTVMRELIETARELMAGNAVSSSVSPLQMQAARLRVRPAKPLPIYLAATGPRMLALGGELADGVFAHVGASAATVELAREGCAAGSRMRRDSLPPLDFSPFLHASVNEDRATAVAACRTGARRVALRTPEYLALVGASAEDVALLRSSPERANEVLTPPIVDALTLSGTAPEVASKLARIAELGVEHVTVFLATDDRLGMIETFGREVMTRFR
jgi:5,10-methylenetetrahydromethanopterin reductase